MFCPVHKWYISRQLDTGKALPGATERHLLRCRSCQAFLSFNRSLPERSAHGLEALLLNAPASRLGPAFFRKAGEDLRLGGTRRHSRLVPILASAALILILAGFVSFSGILKPSPGAVLDELTEWNRSLGGLERAVFTSEIPLEKEYLNLKKTAIRTSEFLKSQLDISLD